MGADHRRGHTLRLKILISYAYWRTYELGEFIELAAEHGNTLQLFVDSGAVTAHNQGDEISLDGYCEWLKANKRHCSGYANLDVITDPKESYQNQLYMEAQGLKPIPVFHRGEPWSLLTKLLAGRRYIAVGGMVSDPGNKTSVVRWLIEVFKRAEGRPIHGFGVNRRWLADPFPFYSIDATSWQSGAQFGTLKLWDRRTSRMVIMQQHDGKTMLDHLQLVRDYDLDPKILAGERNEHYHYGPPLVAGFHASRAYEGWLRRRHGPVKFARHRPGLHLYAATASANHVRRMATTTTQPSWLPDYADVDP